MFFYNFAIQVYVFVIKIASLFSKKAKLWLAGRKNIFERINNEVDINSDIAWFHAASLGEFEQGRPVIEKFKVKFPKKKILLTFFSPSGYEIRKNYEHADYIFYLPVDTKRNASKFIKLINPKIVFFIKYEFWFHYLMTLKENEIPTFLFSAIFRRNQIFFKKYGGLFRKKLNCFNQIFVQNQESFDLLKTININKVSVTGDTRFDRVYEIVRQSKTFSEIENFLENKKCIVCGSTWEPDEKLIAKIIKENRNIKFIIAPHQISTSHIDKLEKLLEFNCVKHSEIQRRNSDKQVLIIDNVGMLSSIYRHALLAYIGGGFGVGIHNILEAATYGIPVLFGPNYQKFKEAKDLILIGGAMCVNNFEVFQTAFTNLIKNEDILKKKGKLCSEYVEKNTGATEKILLNIT